MTFNVKIKAKVLLLFCQPLFKQNFVHGLYSLSIMSFLSLVSWIIPLRKLICINKLRFVTKNLFYKSEIHRKILSFSRRPKFDIDRHNRVKWFYRVSHRKRFIHIPWYAVFAVPNDRKSSIDAKYDERTIYTKYDAVYGTGNFGIILNNTGGPQIVQISRTQGIVLLRKSY